VFDERSRPVRWIGFMDWCMGIAVAEGGIRKSFAREARVQRLNQRGSARFGDGGWQRSSNVRVAIAEPIPRFVSRCRSVLRIFRRRKTGASLPIFAQEIGEICPRVVTFWPPPIATGRRHAAPTCFRGAGGPCASGKRNRSPGHGGFPSAGENLRAVGRSGDKLPGQRGGKCLFGDSVFGREMPRFAPNESGTQPAQRASPTATL
jgi:hypothetical protein